MRQTNIPGLISSATPGVSANSAAVNAENLFQVSLQVIATGTPTGTATVKLQASNDIPAAGAAPTNWTDITGATVTIAAAGAVLIPKTEICYQWIRAVYTNGGAATGTVVANLKALGA